jgi:aminopeptidase N
MAGEASARAVKRIEDVRQLRQSQYPEDAGPMAHPVRPDQYQAIDNFYTATVYDKGAEVVRMMATLVGRAGFRRGMDLYFARHDGQAVTCDDFAQAIAEANPGSALAERLDGFKHWYAQAGTPRLQAEGHFDAETGRYTLTLRQHTPATPGQPLKQPFVIPVVMGLLDTAGQPIAGTDRVLVLDSTAQSWTFEGLSAAPVPSLLRGFSAPVILEWDASETELFTLLGHDTDAFNRWEAGQRLAVQRLLNAVRSGAGLVLDEAYLSAMRAVLNDAALDAAFKELVLTLPSEGYLAERMAEAGEPIDPQQIHAARESMRAQLARSLHADWVVAWEQNSQTGGYQPDPVSCGRRALANLALANLVLDGVAHGESLWQGKALQRFKDAGNMTDRLGALAALVHGRSSLAGTALERFHTSFSSEALVIDKWFALQAATPEHDGQVFAHLQALTSHPDYSLRNPNRARSLLMTLTQLNPGAFHRADGTGYAFWAAKVQEVDGFNPQLASRLARALDRWRALTEPYRGHARAAIERVAAKADLSADTREIVTRALAD